MLPQGSMDLRISKQLISTHTIERVFVLFQTVGLSGKHTHAHNGEKDLVNALSFITTVTCDQPARHGFCTQNMRYNNQLSLAVILLLWSFQSVVRILLYLSPYCASLLATISINCLTILLLLCPISLCDHPISQSLPIDLNG